MEYNIQGIRAIAILFVFVFHLNSGLLPDCFIGVEIFFVISGFLITTIIQKNNRYEITLIESLVIIILSVYPNLLKSIILKYLYVYNVDLARASVFDNIPYFNDIVMYYDNRHIKKYGSIIYAENREIDFMELYRKLR